MWPPGDGRERTGGRAPERWGCLDDVGGALGGWRSEPGLLNDKSAGDRWGPAPGGGKGERGAGLRAADPVRRLGRSGTVPAHRPMEAVQCRCELELDNPTLVYHSLTGSSV